MGECKVIHRDCCAACSVISCEHFVKLRSEVLCTVQCPQLSTWKESNKLHVGNW